MCNQAPLRVSNTAQATSSPAKAPLAIQQMPGTTLAKVDNADGSLAAIGALIRYSNNQAYFVLQHIDESLSRKAVIVSTPDINEPLNLRIDAVEENLPMRSHLPMYIQVHHNAPERLILEHLIDNLAETTLGRQNLELKKNVTIDLFDSDTDAYIRDRAGFFVSDRQQFRELTFQTSEALPVLKADETVLVQKFQTKEFQDLIDYDNTLSPQTRPDFLEYLSTKCKIYVAKPKNAKKLAEDDEEDKEKLNIHGYIVIGGENARILALYAQNQQIANTLLNTYIKEAKPKTVTFCAIREHWGHLISLPHTTERQIYRRHTRAVPSNVKWERIFAVNIGMNLF